MNSCQLESVSSSQDNRRAKYYSILAQKDSSSFHTILRSFGQSRFQRLPIHPRIEDVVQALMTIDRLKCRGDDDASRAVSKCVVETREIGKGDDDSISLVCRVPKSVNR